MSDVVHSNFDLVGVLDLCPRGEFLEVLQPEQLRHWVALDCAAVDAVNDIRRFVGAPHLQDCIDTSLKVRAVLPCCRCVDSNLVVLAECGLCLDAEVAFLEWWHRGPQDELAVNVCPFYGM